MANLENKLAVPLILDERQISKHYARKIGGGGRVDDEILAQLEKAMAMARDAAERALSIHDAVRADETITIGMRKVRIKENVTRIAQAAAKRLDLARAAATAELNKIKNETSQPARPAGVDGAMESEIRTALRTMSADDRAKAIANAIGQADSVVTRAFLTGPAFLSGVSHTEQDLRRSEWRMRTHRAAVERERRLTAALGALDRGAQSLVTFVAQLTDTAIDIERGQQMAAKVIASVEPVA